LGVIQQPLHCIPLALLDRLALWDAAAEDLESELAEDDGDLEHDGRRSGFAHNTSCPIRADEAAVDSTRRPNAA
jgi:hypothetical protein